MDHAAENPLGNYYHNLAETTMDHAAENPLAGKQRDLGSNLLPLSVRICFGSPFSSKVWSVDSPVTLSLTIIKY